MKDTSSKQQTKIQTQSSAPRKVAMYVVKWLCDLTLSETAREFGVTSYGAVGWACAQVRAKQDTEPQFKKRVEEVEMSISQRKCWPLYLYFLLA